MANEKQPVEKLQEGDIFWYGGRSYTAHKITRDADEVRIQIEPNRQDLLCLKHGTFLKIEPRSSDDGNP